jgi:hypothetical protein
MGTEIIADMSHHWQSPRLPGVDASRMSGTRAFDKRPSGDTAQASQHFGRCAQDDKTDFDG